MLGALSAIWGASYLQIKIGLRDFSPAMVAWLRISLAALVLLGIAGLRGGLAGIGRRWPLVIGLGAVQVAGPFTLISAGETEITSSLAGILVASSPLFTALLAIFFDADERSHGLRMVGVLMGFVGVAVLLGVDLGGSGAALLGGLAVVLASFGYAVGGLWVKARFANVSPTGLAAWVMVASSVLLLPAALATLPDSAPGAGPVVAVATLGVVGTGVAFALFYGLFARIGPARTFVVSYLAPVFAVIYGATLLSEPISAATLAGMLLILGGSWFAVGGRLRLGRLSPPPVSRARARPPT